jgi:hypothetical protein
MAAPDSLRWMLGALMLVVATYHAMRLTDRASGRNRGRIDIEVTHFAMGLAMAAMLVAVLPRLANQVVAGVFLIALAWFVTDAIHSFIWDGTAAARSSALQVPICAAMAYILLVPLTRLCPAWGRAAMPQRSSPRRWPSPSRSRRWLHSSGRFAAAPQAVPSASAASWR